MRKTKNGKKKAGKGAVHTTQVVNVQYRLADNGGAMAFIYGSRPEEEKVFMHTTINEALAATQQVIIDKLTPAKVATKATKATKATAATKATKATAARKATVARRAKVTTPKTRKTTKPAKVAPTTPKAKTARKTTKPVLTAVPLTVATTTKPKTNKMAVASNN